MRTKPWKPDTLTKIVWEHTADHCWYCGQLTLLTDANCVQFLAHAKGYRDTGEYLLIYPRQGEPGTGSVSCNLAFVRHVYAAF